MERRYNTYLIVFFVLALIVCSFPFLFVTFHTGIDFTQTGQIGSTIGGVMAPFIAIGAAYLTFNAFWVQFQANRQQRDDIEVDRFETKYYELLRLHRDNVTEMKIRDKFEARRVFVAMYNEFRFCFNLIKHFLEQLTEEKAEFNLGFDPIDDETIVRIAYMIFFHGAGDKSNRLLVEPLQKFCTSSFNDKLLIEIQKRQDEYRDSKNRNDWYCFRLRFKDNTVYEYEALYKPLDGHISRLGHYYRHLFQSVKFVAEFHKRQKENDFTFQDRYAYLKTLRAQLSSHEQVMLYYNALTALGSKWLDPKNPYLIRYKMIKNLPLPLAYFGIKPEKKFEKEIAELKARNEVLFEWHE